jgi:predicted  nucleic acid-binding Zn-ribbon protein
MANAESSIEQKRASVTDLRAQREAINLDIEAKRLVARQLSRQIVALENAIPAAELTGKVARVKIGQRR